MLKLRAVLEHLCYQLPIIVELQPGQIMKDRNIIVRRLQLIRLKYVGNIHNQNGAKFKKNKNKSANESHFCVVFHPIPSAYGGQYN